MPGRSLHETVKESLEKKLRGEGGEEEEEGQPQGPDEMSQMALETQRRRGWRN